MLNKINLRLLRKLMTPPIIPILFNKLKKLIHPESLFGGDDHMFFKYTKNINVYGEYGIGESTNYIYHNTNCKIIACDTSRQWVDLIKQGKDSQRLFIEYIDLGSIGDMGRPKTYEKRRLFINYISSIWNQCNNIDVVLIDGRFRVACFLYSVLHIKSSGIIFFDDYYNRPHYHVVEEIVRPIKVLKKRMAVFIIQEEINKEKAKELMNSFLYVMD